MPHPDTPSPIRLRLHGPALAEGPAGQALPLRGRAALLVALAALEPGGVARERAAVLLWPEASNPRQNLRQQLLRFRQALGAPLLEGEAHLQLAPGVAWLPTDPAAELLAGELAGADEAGAWLQQQRQREQQQRVRQTRAALAAAEARQDADETLSQALQLVRLDPDDELHHAALMRAHYLLGDATAGLRVHERWLALRGRAAAATQAVAAALQELAAGQAARHTALAVAPVTLQRPPRLAGRETERQAVAAAWDQGRAVLLLGEAGMGKSRLLAECVSGAAAGGVAWMAAGRPGDAGSPYSTLARLLGPWLRGAGESMPEPARSLLQRVLGPAVEAPGAVVRPGDLQAAVTACLRAAQPRCVALDDLHFADPATLELVNALLTPAAEEPAPPARWILAQRPAEAPPAAQALVDSLTELQALSVVPLAALSPLATRELLGSLGLAGVDEARLAEALSRHCGGNPLYLLETLKQGLADGSLARGDLPRPPQVGALIERRLARLSPPALNLARVAALAGVDFSIELAEAALGQPALHLAAAWHELQQAQVLHDEAFAHDLVADAVLRGVPQVVARRVRAQCADWLQAHGGDPARVARHWREGSRPAEAARSFEQAALRAHAAARQAEEAELHGQAAAAWADAGEPAARFEALAARVSALIGAQADEAAVAEARALQTEAATPAQRVRALRVLADLLGQRGPFEEAVAVGRAGIALAREQGESAELVRIASLTAGNLCKLGQADEAYTILLPLREWVDGSADDTLRFVWYGYWAATLGHIGRLREGVAAYDTAAAAAERSSDRAGQSMACLNQSVVLRTMGALQRAFEGSQRGLALAPQDAGNANQRLARLMHARNEAETGAFAPALATLEALLPEFEAMGAPFWVWATRGTLARLWQHLGQPARALQALRDPPAEGLPAWMQAGLAWSALELAHWRDLRVEPAPVEHARALLDGDANRSTGNRVRGLRFATPEAVLQQAPALAETAQQHEQFGVLAALRLHEARAAIAQRQPQRAGLAAQALTALLDAGYAPEFSYLPEAWLVAAEAHDHAGQVGAAQHAQAAGVAWVQTKALPQVPAAFIDSFLQRNPVNRRLLASATRPAAG